MGMASNSTEGDFSLRFSSSQSHLPAPFLSSPHPHLRPLLSLLLFLFQNRNSETFIEYLKHRTTTVLVLQQAHADMESIDSAWLIIILQTPSHPTWIVYFKVYETSIHECGLISIACQRKLVSFCSRNVQHEQPLCLLTRMLTAGMIMTFPKRKVFCIMKYYVSMYS